MRTFSWLNPKIRIRNIKKYGKGLFATCDINKDEFLAVFGGHIISLKELKELPKKVQDMGLQISENMLLGYRKESEIEDVVYYNHSCDPNSGFMGQIMVVAMKPIKNDEQVTFDYAMTLHKSKGIEYYKIKCLCGSKKCRGYVTEDDWKIPELQKRYDGYFQWYLQEKIDKLKKKDKY